MLCRRCGAENADTQRFCGQCGAKLEAPQEAVAVPNDPGAYYCVRHTKTITRVRCGRCETPICPRCMVFSPAGTRCRDCARNRVPLRPLGVLHEAGKTIGSGARGAGRVVWYMAIWYLIISIFTGFGGHRD